MWSKFLLRYGWALNAEIQDMAKVRSMVLKVQPKADHAAEPGYICSEKFQATVTDIKWLAKSKNNTRPQ